MHLTDFFKTMGRRWYVTVLGVAATASLCVLAFQAVSPSYEARGSALLLPPENAVEEGGNPFLQLGELSQMLNVLVKYLDSDVERERIAALAPTAEYEVARDEGTNGPIVVFTVEDSTEGGALSAVGLLLDSVPTALVTLQDSVGVPAEAEVTSMTLAADTEPTVILTTTIRAVLVVLAGGLIVTAMLVALVDAWARRRTARVEARRRTPTPGPDGRAGEPDRPDTRPTSTGRAGDGALVVESGPPDTDASPPDAASSPEIAAARRGRPR